MTSIISSKGEEKGTQKLRNFKNKEKHKLDAMKFFFWFSLPNKYKGGGVIG